MNLTDSITGIKGIGPKKAEALHRLGIETVEDFLHFYPRTYEDRRQIQKIGELEDLKYSLVVGKVLKVTKARGRFGKGFFSALIADSSGGMEAVFFNQNYLAGLMRPGTILGFYGRAALEKGKTRMINPKVYKRDEISLGIFPIYPLTRGISQNDIAKAEKALLREENLLSDYLSEREREEYELCDYGYALNNFHFPSGKEAFKVARYRLIFDEFLLFSLGILMMKGRGDKKDKGIAFKGPQGKFSEFAEGLPFQLTEAQKKVAREIEENMEKPVYMNRLVQGDVGSGKTVIAQMALYKAVKNGYQGVLMAPTEILARQHFDSIKKDFESYGINTVFLSGSQTAKEKKEVLKQISDGTAQVIIGTHAIIQPGVEFSRLGLVITDEQHRFGVNQRMNLACKGENPDILVMTATPIPRTLAVIMYGDLDISVIDSLPPGRQKIITRAANSADRERVYDFVRSEIEKGRQAYVVTPLIEDSENMEDVLSAEGAYEDLKEHFRNYNVDLLHGRMKQGEKDSIMEDFYAGRIEILVSTVVIEVGINVPNATMMVIENAERFGLAQLHQLRGRVGRGEHQSYCLLISSGKNQVSQQRIKTMTKTTDGFIIAEEDLKLRGPGEFFGLRQHGLPDLKLGDILRHSSIFNQAKEAAAKCLMKDPELADPEFAQLKERVNRLYNPKDRINL